jgi:hypothetical protein
MSTGIKNVCKESANCVLLFSYNLCFRQECGSESELNLYLQEMHNELIFYKITIKTKIIREGYVFGKM